MIDGQITYIKGHKSSERQSQECLASFNKFKGWNVRLIEGITPISLDFYLKKYPYEPAYGSRLSYFMEMEKKLYAVKCSCVTNHLRFCEIVIENKKPMIFLEHDAICIGNWIDQDFDEYLILTAQWAFSPPSVHRKYGYKFPEKEGIFDLPDNYPLVYNVYNGKIGTQWCGSFVSPGTTAYALTPKGAEKILKAARTYGLEQSDLFMNTNNIHLQYIYPSPVRYNAVNLRTSWNFQESFFRKIQNFYRTRIASARYRVRL